MSAGVIAINPWMMLPFGVLLGMLALAPLLCPAWWASHYPKVAMGLACPTLAYYFIGLHASAQVWSTAHEYVSFIALIGSLFIVAGGIHINVPGSATPLANTIFLLIGAVLANILGTTGASMLLIRPWLRMNKSRARSYHVVFFIFIVSNVGGCLTPIGDPPLFLGYLMGIPFWWVAEHCFPMWAVAVGLLLLMFFVLDYKSSRISQTVIQVTLDKQEPKWHFRGLTNVFFLAIILGAVFIEHPSFLREGLMILAATGSYFLTGKSIHESNQFNFHPIQEVAILFIGIFATMMPALDWLQGNAANLETMTTSMLYWSSGCLSSALDNAPTYLCFLKTISSHFANADVATQVHQIVQNQSANISSFSKAGMLGNTKFSNYILAISIGSVFFGANSYIGNGPNFMVKAIADQQKVPTPDFMRYIWGFALPFMGPTLLIVWWLFFRQ